VYGTEPPARLDSQAMLRSTSLAAIEFYQRHVSPRKGYVCAMRARTGGRSCSRYAARAIARAGVWAGAILLQRRLRACGAAAAAFQEEAATNSPAEPSFEDRHCGGCAGSVTAGRELCCGNVINGMLHMYD
jgi:putative component of membrane protein insertase Oxa1/YidC/SpoIIIJ protein YidD